MGVDYLARKAAKKGRKKMNENLKPRRERKKKQARRLCRGMCILPSGLQCAADAMHASGRARFIGLQAAMLDTIQQCSCIWCMRNAPCMCGVSDLAMWASSLCSSLNLLKGSSSVHCLHLHWSQLGCSQGKQPGQHIQPSPSPAARLSTIGRTWPLSC